jgi:hypothetical protein
VVCGLSPVPRMDITKKTSSFVYKIGLHVQNMIVVLGSTIDVIGRGRRLI